MKEDNKKLWKFFVWSTLLIWVLDNLVKFSLGVDYIVISFSGQVYMLLIATLVAGVLTCIYFVIKKIVSLRNV